ncbi:proteasome assembly chaperone family protein [Natronomonas sp. EA1]|uniref:proteasome assembly chaperone family protein n=1 Tax=Natronomonas sp. EA1 TaxID=3421655 RepID=UPI003EB8D24F
MFGIRGSPGFNIRTDESPSKTLLCGFSEFGLAGLTTVDYLVKQLELEQTGHIEVDQLPTITPFENGRPRHHTRLFSRDDLDITVLVGELFVPGWAAEPFGDAILDWTEQNAVEEIVVASGVPVAHGPDEHRTFYIASPDYREAHLTDTDIPPMAGGFLDGVNGAIMARGIDSTLRTCVLTTPAHEQTPDAAAALRLLETVCTLYDLDVERAPLEAFANRVSAYYEELAGRVAAAKEETGGREDRMYM